MDIGPVRKFPVGTARSAVWISALCGMCGMCELTVTHTQPGAVPRGHTTVSKRYQWQ